MIKVFGFIGTVSPRLVEEVASADLVVGGRRHLEALNISDDKAQILGRLEPAIERLRKLNSDQKAIVIASGDPLLYGIVRKLRQAGLSLQVFPEVSSVQLSFAAVALPWDDARIVSAHSHDLSAAIAVCRVHPKVAVLTAPNRGLPEIVKELSDLDRYYVLAERLGETDEQVRILTTAQAAKIVPSQPNVVLVLAHHPDSSLAIGDTPAIQGDSPINKDK